MTAQTATAEEKHRSVLDAGGAPLRFAASYERCVVIVQSGESHLAF